MYSIEPNISANGPKMLHRLERAHIIHRAVLGPSNYLTLPSKTQDRRPLHLDDLTAGERRRLLLPLPASLCRIVPSPPLSARARTAGQFLPCASGNEPYTSLRRIGCLPGPLIRTVGAGPASSPFSIDSDFPFLLPREFWPLR